MIQTVLLSFFEVFNPRLAAWAKLSLSPKHIYTRDQNYTVLFYFQGGELAHQSCALAEPGGHWCLTFALGLLGILIFFIEILGT